MIVGLGLMGGSLALALDGHCADLYAVDPDQATLEFALAKGIVSRAEADPVKLLPLADVAILAAPVPAILSTLARLPDWTPRPCIVLDLGSSKQAILEGMSALPARFDPLGGHPICGRERLSLVNADAALYRGAPFVLTPLPRTTARARACALQIIEAIEARPLWMDAVEHDRLLAATSHLPYLLLSALVLATPLECAPLAGPGFRSTSRLAGTPASMMLGVLHSNRENVLQSLARFRASLDRLEAALAENNLETLEHILRDARAQYQLLTS